MATTITISEETKVRLLGYKHGDASYDDVLNALMDRVPVEDVAAEQVEEHYRRLKDFKAVSVEEFKARLAKRGAKGRGNA